jgi:hypothetical protein
MLRLHSQDITHPDDHADDARALQRLAAGDLESDEGERRFIRSDGSAAEA